MKINRKYQISKKFMNFRKKTYEHVCARSGRVHCVWIVYDASQLGMVRLSRSPVPLLLCRCPPFYFVLVLFSEKRQFFIQNQNNKVRYIIQNGK